MLPFAIAQPREPAPTAIYYGYPSLVNSANGDLGKAARVFNAYRLIVLGDQLEFRSHPDHNNVQRILSMLTNPRVFGYICIGATQRLPIEEVQSRVMAWKQTGVQGIFIDEAGNDFAVTHDRREKIFEFIHQMGLSIFVNAFNPDDVFEEGTRLGKGDFYLLESFVVRLGELDESAAMNSRLEKVLRYRRHYKVGVVGVTTTTGMFSAGLYRKACHAAAQASLDGFGWGEPSFSSKSNTLRVTGCADAPAGVGLHSYTLPKTARSASGVQ